MDLSLKFKSYLTLSSSCAYTSLSREVLTGQDTLLLLMHRNDYDWSRVQLTQNMATFLTAQKKQSSLHPPDTHMHINIHNLSQEIKQILKMHISPNQTWHFPWAQLLLLKLLKLMARKPKSSNKRGNFGLVRWFRG